MEVRETEWEISIRTVWTAAVRFAVPLANPGAKYVPSHQSLGIVAVSPGPTPLIWKTQWALVSAIWRWTRDAVHHPYGVTSFPIFHYWNKARLCQSDWVNILAFFLSSFSSFWNYTIKPFHLFSIDDINYCKNGII